VGRDWIRLRDYPKFTPLHEYIEEIVTDVIWEEHGADESKLLDAHDIRWGKKLWVDHLLHAHGFQNSFIDRTVLLRGQRRSRIQM
jgi:hypothetical protein